MPKYAIEITLRDKNSFRFLAVEGRSIDFETEDEARAISIWARGRDAVLDLLEKMENDERDTDQH